MGVTTPGAAQVRNWFGSILSSPAIVVYPRSVDEIAQILIDPEHYPGPVRAVGSNHSTTPCGVADGGTLLVMRHFDRILDIGGDSVTVEAGALYIDVARQLQRYDLQFHVNVELGNLSMGSAACGRSHFEYTTLAPKGTRRRAKTVSGARTFQTECSAVPLSNSFGG